MPCTCETDGFCGSCDARECERVTTEREAENADYDYALDVIALLNQLKWSCDNGKALEAIEHAKHCVAMTHNLPLK